MRQFESLTGFLIRSRVRPIYSSITRSHPILTPTAALLLTQMRSRLFITRIGIGAFFLLAFLFLFVLRIGNRLDLLFCGWVLAYLFGAWLLSLVIGRLLNSEKKKGLARILCHLGILISLLVIFSFAPMEITPNFRAFERNAHSMDKNTFEAQLVIEEHKKAVEEIRNRDLEDDSWFHNKFLLVGGLLAATLGYLKFGYGKTPEERFANLSGSKVTVVILALACVVAIGIDLHVRDSQTTTDELGLWIRSYVEPMLHGGTGNGKKTMSDFIGWEEFLRTEAANGELDAPGPSGVGLHSSDLWNLLNAQHVHFLTVLLYLLYVCAFQALALKTRTNNDSHLAQTVDLMEAPPSITFYCFTIVHASLLAFVWIAHSAPEMFEFKALPFAGKWESGAIVPAYYMAPCLALVILNWPYLVRYWRSQKSSA